MPLVYANKKGDDQTASLLFYHNYMYIKIYVATCPYFGLIVFPVDSVGVVIPASWFTITGHNYDSIIISTMHVSNKNQFVVVTICVRGEGMHSCSIVFYGFHLFCCQVQVVAMHS